MGTPSGRGSTNGKSAMVMTRTKMQGSTPAPRRPPKAKITVTEDVVLHFKEYKKRVGESWGPLHVIMSDGNLGRSFIENTLTDSIQRMDGDTVHACKWLLSMTKTQIRKLYRRAND